MATHEWLPSRTDHGVCALETERLRAVVKTTLPNRAMKPSLGLAAQNKGGEFANETEQSIATTKHDGRSQG